MTSIQMHSLTKQFGSVTAVRDLTLEIPSGHFAALLGPSGCGKSTTMNMISGLERPTRGDLFFDSERINEVPPGKRSVGFVFQNYAIFTHMTVYDNLAFGLKMRGDSKASIDAEVGKVARMLHIEPLLPLRTTQLSVNDLQKVALGRSIIIRPRIFLLDEPFSNLDAAFRAYMRTELKLLQREIGQTMIYVTHDQIEAMSMADHIAVMNRAELQQYGSPDDVYLRPANLFVARFIGSPSMNLIAGRCQVEAGVGCLIARDGMRIRLDDASLDTIARAGADEVVIGMRPEHLHLHAGSADDPLTMQATVYAVEPLGAKTVLHCETGALHLQVLIKSNAQVRIGEQRTLRIAPERVYLFDAASERAISGALSATLEAART
jgi:multiple sugar transport system ATP-binding protein